MTTALAQRTGLENLSLAETKDLGQVFVQSGYFRDARDASQAIVKVLYGRELGFSPVVSMMGIHIVEGKPELSANMLATLVKQSGRYNYRVIENTEERCAITFYELPFTGGHPEECGQSVFTMDDARRASLVRKGSGWEKYPKAMLFARAMSAGVRTHCPDVGAGCPVYVEHEISGEGPKPGSAEPAPTENVTVEPPKRNIEGEAYSKPADSKPAIGDDDGPKFIDRTSQNHLHGLAKARLKGKKIGAAMITPHHADMALEHLLRELGHVDEDGRGSTKFVPLSQFATVEAEIRDRIEAMVKFVEDLKVGGAA